MQKTTRISTVPPLFFSRKWKHELIKTKINCDGLAWIDRENVVMHIAMKPLSHRSFLRTATGSYEKKKCENRRTFSLQTYSGADLDSPFSHLRFNTKNDGKILKFEKNRNLIRGTPKNYTLILACIINI